MAIAYSKLTSQGQISVPAGVRQKLGIGPGSVLEWDTQDGRVVVRRAGRYTSEDLHRVLFSVTPKRRTLRELKEGIRKHLRGRHARR
jgi:AbrB family looped-hinge helix DNA binding protein